MLLSCVVLAHSRHYESHEKDAANLAKFEQVKILMNEARLNNDQDKFLVVKKIIEKLQKTSQVRLYLAEIQQYFHQFDMALETLAPIKNNANSNLLRASIYFTQGKVKLAHHECAQLFGGIDSLLAITCLSQANSLLGQLDRAYQVLEAALPHMAGANTESEAWAYITLAEMAERKQDVTAAIKHYHKALVINRNDIATRIALADLLLDKNDYPAVIKLAESHLYNDQLLLRYVRALNIQGDLRTSDHFCELKRRVLSYLGTSEYSRQQQHLHFDLIAEYFLYFSPDHELALDWAKKHWQQQKTPRDTRLLLKVAIEAGDDAVIDEIRHWHSQYHTEDRRLESLLKGSLLAMDQE